MKKSILLLFAGFILLSACSHDKYTGRGIVKPKKHGKCGTCPVW